MLRMQIYAMMMTLAAALAPTSRPMLVDRRAVLAVPLVMGGTPALASEDAETQALTQLWRVVEALDIEKGIVETGKFPDPRRKVIKDAAAMMVNNFQLHTNLAAASSLVPPQDFNDAMAHIEHTATAIQNVQDYPDDLIVGDLDDRQKQFILNNFQTARDSLTGYMDLMPSDKVKIAKRLINE